MLLEGPFRATADPFAQLTVTQNGLLAFCTNVAIPLLNQVDTSYVKVPTKCTTTDIRLFLTTIPTHSSFHSCWHPPTRVPPNGIAPSLLYPKNRLFSNHLFHHSPSPHDDEGKCHTSSISIPRPTASGVLSNTRPTMSSYEYAPY